MTDIQDSDGTVSGGGETRSLPRNPRPASGPGREAARFPPGTIIAGRYRIIDPLGHGGMGEVVRAEDTSLGQTVALKFLPSALADDPRALDRLREEVRLGRRVSHPNVCRVHDLGQEGAQRFLSMEYVDGEDLAALLRRVGRFAGDRALEIARELCAGLAAAHAAGVIHRDLKPSNVMLDRAGHVRITDFGLALPREAGGGAGEVAGTPAYMAPEQLAGMGATVRSDLYALGLILYELFTGRGTFPEATTLSELLRLRRETPVVPPIQLVRDIDPQAQRMILACLAARPEERPESALEVLTGLSGGDPMQAALAAGQTPSPAAVAAAKVVGALSPFRAWACVLAVLAAFAIQFLWAGPALSALERLRPPYPPAVLQVKAEEAMRALGQDRAWVDRASGFSHDDGALRRAAALGGDAAKRAETAAAGRRTIVFWHRCSAVRLEPATASVHQDAPAMEPGESLAVLDMEGHLLRFRHVPDAGDSTPGPPDALATFQRLAGTEGPVPAGNLDPNARLGFETRIDGRVPARVEAELRGGRLVSAAVLLPWTPPVQAGAAVPGPGDLLDLTGLLFLVSSILLAYRNIRAGRGDTRGAWRIGLLLFGLNLAATLLRAHHTGSIGRESFVLILGSQRALYTGTTSALVYLALEPHVRKVWPQNLVSWTRLLAGRFRDPMVARDLLLAFGSASAVLGPMTLGMLLLKSRVALVSPKYDLLPLFGAPECLAAVLSAIAAAFQDGLLFLLLLLLVSPLRRFRGLAPSLFIAILGAMFLAAATLLGWSTLVFLPFALVLTWMLYLQLTQLGLLAMVGTVFLLELVMAFPNPSSLIGWTAFTTWWQLGTTLLAIGWALHAATGGRPFGERDPFAP